MRATVRARAKINLTLDVLAREEGGYHTIETVFHRIDLADDVEVVAGAPGGVEVECDADVGPPEANLAARAATAYREAAGWNAGITIRITKRIPTGAGLGGGSADAAATLRALDALAPSPLGRERLLALATGLGADVPFLASDAAMALAWGRGERMLALPALPVRHVVLLVPGQGVATAAAYDACTPAPPAARLLRAAELASWDGIARMSHNALRVAVVRRLGRADIARAIAALRRSGAEIAEMTGSGCAVFGIFGGTPDVGPLTSPEWTVLVTATSSGQDGADAATRAGVERHGADE